MSTPSRFDIIQSMMTSGDIIKTITWLSTKIAFNLIFTFTLKRNFTVRKFNIMGAQFC